MKRPTPEEVAKSLQCTTEGCTRPWSSDINGRLCLVCRADRPKMPALSEPARPYSEAAERDEEDPK